MQNVKQVGSVIKLTFNDDLNVEYHKKTGLLSIEINPFYFASTGGLLGVFDNEPAFDFINPDGELERSVEDFARSWEVKIKNFYLYKIVILVTLCLCTDKTKK